MDIVKRLEFIMLNDTAVIQQLIADAMKEIEQLRAKVAELEKDANRLNWMIANQAHMGFDRDGEACQVFVDEEPPCGWGVTFSCPREAIDKAMELNPRF